jgi:hypothetical protein
VKAKYSLRNWQGKLISIWPQIWSPAILPLNTFFSDVSVCPPLYTCSFCGFWQEHLRQIKFYVLHFFELSFLLELWTLLPHVPITLPLNFVCGAGCLISTPKSIYLRESFLAFVTRRLFRNLSVQYWSLSTASQHWHCLFDTRYKLVTVRDGSN